MKITQLLNEARLQHFDDVDVIKIDPDRDGPHEIVERLMPVLAKVAYTYLMGDKSKHERTHGPKSDEEDAYNFDFTKGALRDNLEELIGHVCNRMKDMSQRELDAVIEAAAKDFKEKPE